MRTLRLLQVIFVQVALIALQPVHSKPYKHNDQEIARDDFGAFYDGIGKITF